MIVILSSCETQTSSLGSEIPIDSKTLTWKDLADIEYEESYLEELDAWFWQPIFSSKVCDLDKEQVSISGYLQSMNSKSDTTYFICAQKKMHFGCCGITEPHHIIQLNEGFNPKSHDIGDPVLINGILTLNHNNVYEHNYQMRMAFLE